MKRNVHIYFSEMRNESRIFKIADTLYRHEVFDEIYILGRVAFDLPPIEKLNERATIFRLDAPFLSLLRKASGLRSLLWYIAAIIKVMNLQPQILSLHSVSFLPLAMLVKLCRPSMEIIYETHELETETNGASYMKKMLRRHVEAIGMRFVAHTIAVSPSICEWYATRYRTRAVSLVMNCPPFLEKRKSDYLRNHFNLSSEKIVFLYQGIMRSGRGIEGLVAALEKLPEEAVLVLLGYGDDFDKWYERSLTSPRLFIHPAVPFEKVLEVTSSADCGISFMEDTCLSHRFALPNKLFEFIQARIAVIVSPTIDQSNLVVETGVGLVCDGFDEDAIRLACEKFMLGMSGDLEANLDRAAQIYSWQSQEENLLKAYMRFG